MLQNEIHDALTEHPVLRSLFIEVDVVEELIQVVENCVGAAIGQALDRFRLVGG